MPWTTPTLKETRRLVRDYVTTQLQARSMIPNSVLRIMSDAKAGLAHLTLLYIDWLAKQLLPDSAETEWLDRHGNIWLKNSDGSKGRKAPVFAQGSVLFTGPTAGIAIPVGTILTRSNSITYQTTEVSEIGVSLTADVPTKALTEGAVGNADEGEVISVQTPISGVDGQVTIVSMEGGADEETDEQLRARVLFRIQHPPMGGDSDDYILWATAVPGVTRAWQNTEMGVGTATVRFLMDQLRSANHGLPEPDDIEAVRAYLDSVRPVTVKDMYVQAPIPYFYDLTISDLEDDSDVVKQRIEDAIKAMEFKRSKPGQTMYRSWVDEAISGALGEDHHELTFATQVMPGAGYMPMVGTITYA